MNKEKILEKIVGISIMGGFIAINSFGVYFFERAIQSSGGITRMGIPSKYEIIFDKNNDGMADKVIQRYVGAMIVPVSITRKPTQEEIKWYKSQIEEGRNKNGR